MQTVSAQIEVIVIDSGSSDGTGDIARERNARVVDIRPEEFNHGATRNLGARLAGGELIVMTVQDARAVDDRWIERMIGHFADPQVSGVCGQQIVPHDADKNPLQWFRPYSEPAPRKLHFSSAEEFDSLTPREQTAACAWDDVTAMYRRSALMAVPFRSVMFAEDMIWARDALRSGMRIVYDYRARVYHYHREDLKYRFRRDMAILYHRYEYFGFVPPPEPLLLPLLRTTVNVSRRQYCPQHRLTWLLYNFRLILAEWSAGWLFWLTARLRDRSAVSALYARVCRTAPEPRRAQ